MKSLQQIINTIESEQDDSIRRNNKVTLYSLVNYLHDGHKGISRYDMDNFLGENQFSAIFQELLNISIISENEKGQFVLNDDVKDRIPPFLQKLTQQVYQTSAE